MATDLSKLYAGAPPWLRRAVQTVRGSNGRGVRWGNLRRTAPFSEMYGFDRGQPVDRYYLEPWMERQRSAIRGTVLEIKDDTYARRFGAPDEVVVLDIVADNPHVTLVADLNVAGCVPPSSLDCVILTHTLQYTDPTTSLRTLWDALRPGGTLLLAVASLGRLDPDALDFDLYRWTPRGLQSLCESLGIPAQVEGFGNALACVCAVMGLAVEDVSPAELDVQDRRFPLLSVARCDKPLS